MRIILMGTGPFAVPSFEALRASGQHELVMVVTRPVSNRTEATNKGGFNPVRAWADLHCLNVIDPISINDDQVIATLESLQPDLLVVCDYGQILSAKTLSSARLGGINLHGSLLPRHRGAAPVQWSILRGDPVTGVCVIHMTPRLDGGPILARVQTEIGPEETADQLEKRLSQMGIPCCFDAIEKLERCSTLDDCMAMGDLQDNSLATPAPRLAKADGQLDFRYSADVIDRQIRGLQPWPGAFGVIQFGNSKELRVILGKARPLDYPSIRASQTDISLQSDLPPEESSPGEILWGAALRRILSDPVESYLSNSDRVPLLAVVCAEKLLQIIQIQPSGKKMLGAREFLAGYGKVERMRFLTPPVDSSRRLLEIVRNSCLEK